MLDNKKCAFVPHVQVAPVESEILLLNSDPILHDVHARIGSETLFNVGLPTWRQVKKRLTRTGIVTIECDVLHTWMSAYILVTSSPHFTVTDEKGEFAIDGIAAGTYEIEVWHEKLGSQSRRVTVTAGSTLRVDFIYRLTTNGPN
ncbi:MAG: carboxypeptidase regulatory-like domain-containing protein [Deltaproteobacteria bacterium]|nr:carboxypeptidase regulatory-like domain-containing protein [Deltaproteobacteria bacterium]